MGERQASGHLFAGMDGARGGTTLQSVVADVAASCRESSLLGHNRHDRSGSWGLFLEIQQTLLL